MRDGGCGESDPAVGHPRLTILIGLRAAGKTTVGRSLAEGWGVPFVETDDLALARFDEPTIEAVFGAHGEAAWRAAERAVVFEEVPGRGVVALGGGTPMIEDVEAWLKAQIVSGATAVVYLACEVETLGRRLHERPGDRPPLLEGRSNDDEVAALFDRRDPVYRGIATTLIDVTHLDTGSVVVRLNAMLGGFSP